MPTDGAHPLIDQVLLKAHNREAELTSTLKAWLRVVPKLRGKARTNQQIQLLEHLTTHLVGKADDPAPETIAEAAWSRSPSLLDTVLSEKPISAAEPSKTLIP